MATPADLPPGTPAGWHTDPANPGRQRWWDGQRWTNRTEASGSPDPLAVLVDEVRRLRGAVNLIAVVAAIQLLLIALWLLGAITVTLD